MIKNNTCWSAGYKAHRVCARGPCRPPHILLLPKCLARTHVHPSTDSRRPGHRPEQHAPYPSGIERKKRTHGNHPKIDRDRATNTDHTHAHRVLVRVDRQRLLPVSLPNLIVCLVTLALEAQDFVSLFARELFGHDFTKPRPARFPSPSAAKRPRGCLPLSLGCSRGVFSPAASASVSPSRVSVSRPRMFSGGTNMDKFARNAPTLLISRSRHPA